MIDLITGLPGNAKTLYALSLVIERAKRETRPVYYSGLKEFIDDDPRLLGTEWIEFDPLQWHEVVPSNSIVFIDECQKIFRNRSMGASPPKHVTELEEHRHKGIDFYMLTQHPSLVDPHIRRLTQTHHHMVRVWGFQVSTVHQWNGVKDNCEKDSPRKDSQKTKWNFRKDLYGLYKSADAHTMKAGIPARVKLLAVLFLVLLVVLAYVVMFFKGKVSGQSGADSSRPAAVAPGAVGSTAVGTSGQPVALVDPVQDARAYVASRTERVVGLPHTAPRYDEITSAVRAPVPAMCVQVGDVRSRKKIDCKCYTQQGTPMQVEFNMCIEFARNGWFQDFNPEAESQSMDRMAHGQVVMSHRGDVSQGPLGSQVAAFQHPPDVSRIQGRAGN